MATSKKAVSMSHAVEETISAALADGRIDERAQAVQIAVMRKTAAVMDEPGWPIIGTENGGNGRFDNVSPSTLLKCCDALGIDPPKDAVAERRTRIAAMRTGVRAMRKAAE